LQLSEWSGVLLQNLSLLPLVKKLPKLYGTRKFVTVGRDSSVGIATRYGLDGPGIESRWGRYFPHPSRPFLGLTQPPAQWVPGLFPEGKAAGGGIDHPPPPSPEVKERVELFLYCPSGPSWRVPGWTFLWRFITVFTTSHLSLFGARLILFSPSKPISLTSSLILSSHLHPGLQSGLFSKCPRTKILYAFLFSPVRATCLAHLIQLCVISLTMLGEAYESCSYTLCNFLQSLVTASLLQDHRVFLSTRFSDTPSVCCSLNVRHCTSFILCL
jgi:hypothetical protein